MRTVSSPNTAAPETGARADGRTTGGGSAGAGAAGIREVAATVRRTATPPFERPRRLRPPDWSSFRTAAALVSCGVSLLGAGAMWYVALTPADASGSAGSPSAFVAVAGLAYVVCAFGLPVAQYRDGDRKWAALTAASFLAYAALSGSLSYGPTAALLALFGGIAGADYLSSLPSERGQNRHWEDLAGSE